MPLSKDYYRHRRISQLFYRRELLMKVLTRSNQNIHYMLDAKNEPRIHLLPDVELKLETERADGMFLSRENPHFRDKAHVMTVRANPVTGPIYVEGAKPGDLLEVEIIEVNPGDDGSEGYFSYINGQGVFANPYYPEFDYPPRTIWCEVNKPYLNFKFSKTALEVAAEPFIGTIGVAPRENVIASYHASKEICGNVDCHYVKKGAKVVLPVNVEGALLSIGDMHAKQGAGELLGCAVECRGSIVIKVKVLKREELYYDWPQVNTATFIGSVAHSTNSIENAIKSASYDIIKRIEHVSEMDFMDSYMLVGQCIQIEICQMIGEFCTAIAMIPKDIMNSLT